MASLIHWDFDPGVKVADQVRARFGSSVHFSPGDGFREFFLVAFFSSASFSLDSSSVGVPLQCCIGGCAEKFKVVQVDDRAFRFSVASNKVGNLIYALKDRIWP